MDTTKQKIYELTGDDSGSLASVLRAIGKVEKREKWKEYFVSDSGLFYSHLTQWRSLGVRWNLAADFDGQTQEVRSFIGKLLGIE